MKKWIIVLAFSMICCMSACDNVSNESEIVDDAYLNEVSDNMDSADNADGTEAKTEVDAINRTIIAGALGVEENNRNIPFILGSLNTISAGQIQSAEVAEDDGEKVINVVAEDGTDYRIYLSGSGSVEAVENLVTGEWPIQSNK